MEIADRRIATIHFTLFDHEGKQVGSTHGHDPLVHMYGTGGIVPGLEKALAGKNAGDRFEVEVAPEEGFGPHHPELVQTLPRSTFNGAQAPSVGRKLIAQTSKGPLEVRVTGLDGDTITVDGNHPLAGKPFRLEVEILEVRVPTPQELQFGV
ncbi:peptidylprolyl isomerase [Luteimonas sp. SX5]|uniref:Peptidyl-prolyl cis-trans isomerase n=1 Tax=Luteimonas galliterrae TaxID=2940486 RepID=A0ABT0MK74_9GAMM|nr:peptidylprolyl isomerase [Luteimonas galliterrae]MCL1635270.1 peptidylprolyl isomerase [Luteimonas galliterrae]